MTRPITAREVCAALSRAGLVANFADPVYGEAEVCMFETTGGMTGAASVFPSAESYATGAGRAGGLMPDVCMFLNDKARTLVIVNAAELPEDANETFFEVVRALGPVPTTTSGVTLH